MLQQIKKILLWLWLAVKSLWLFLVGLATIVGTLYMLGWLNSK